MDSVQSTPSADKIVQPDESLHALVRWRLADPAWMPSFDTLVDDARACISMNAGAPIVLAALMSVLKTNPELAPRARMLAEQAHGTMAARLRNRKVSEGGFARRLLNSFRPAANRV